jgi:hypothetical protein
LTDLAERAVPELERALRRPHISAETRSRAERILAAAKGAALVDGDTGRLLWVIELLERWGTPKAKHLLDKLATGDPNAWITLEAKASLKRLAEPAKDLNRGAPPKK